MDASRRQTTTCPVDVERGMGEAATRALLHSDRVPLSCICFICSMRWAVLRWNRYRRTVVVEKLPGGTPLYERKSARIRRTGRSCRKRKEIRKDENETRRTQKYMNRIPYRNLGRTHSKKTQQTASAKRAGKRSPDLYGSRGIGHGASHAMPARASLESTTNPEPTRLG